MSERTLNEYVPDFVSPPGETLLETIETMGMSQADLADRAGKPKKTINEIIKGKASITPETALNLERVLGIPAAFWINRERQYREFLARRKEQLKLQKQLKWLQMIPISSMIKMGWIEAFSDSFQQLLEVLKFFGVASPKQWNLIFSQRQIAFRRSTAFQIDPGALAAWLRKGAIEAQDIQCKPFNKARFTNALQEIRSLTVEPPEVFQPRMTEMCAEAGVAVVFVPELPKTRVSGSTRWLTPTKALIQLSLRYKTDDHLWFTFFHEAGHILLHGKKEVFLENLAGHEGAKEEEANEFAADILIPPDHFQTIASAQSFSKKAIAEFANRLSIAPGIVVGRIQHEGLLPASHCNDLKQRFTWKAD